jgi:hypothetical protein
MSAHDGERHGSTDAETARMMAECDMMESEFATWFDQTATRLARRKAARSAAVNGVVFHPSLCRGLLLVWATSPTARARYSEEARRGLLAAADSMSDGMFMTLVCGVIGESRGRSQAPAAAA